MTNRDGTPATPDEINAGRQLLGFYNHEGGYQPSGWAHRFILLLNGSDPGRTFKLLNAFPEWKRPIGIYSRHGSFGLREFCSGKPSTREP